MANHFAIKRNGIIEVYDKYEDIPDDLERVIRFLPEYPEGPHTPEQHEEIEAWNGKLQRLMEIERRNRDARSL